MARLPMLLALTLLVAPWSNTVAPAQEKGPSPQNAGTPGSRTDPTGHFTPPSAIDTAKIPNMVLAPSAGPDDPLPYYQVAPDTYMFFGNIAEVDGNNRGWNGNAGFVVTGEGVVVIDSLGTPRLGRRMIATIADVTPKPIKYLIITHNHPDHSYGAIAFRRLGGVKVIAHEGTLDYIQSEKIDGSVSYRRSFLAADMEGFAAVVPDIRIGGERYSQYLLTVGNRTFAIYNVGRHHSFGDLVVHQKEDGVVWISDLAFNQRVTFMGDGNSRQAIDAQDWLLKSFPNARLMIPGHGSAQTAPFPMIRRTQSYMKRMRRIMSDAIAKGRDLQEAVDQATFEDWKNTRLYDLNQRANANFVYLEIESESF